MCFLELLKWKEEFPLKRKGKIFFFFSVVVKKLCYPQIIPHCFTFSLIWPLKPLTLPQWSWFYSGLPLPPALWTLGWGDFVSWAEQRCGDAAGLCRDRLPLESAGTVHMGNGFLASEWKHQKMPVWSTALLFLKHAVWLVSPSFGYGFPRWGWSVLAVAAGVLWGLGWVKCWERPSGRPQPVHRRQGEPLFSSLLFNLSHSPLVSPYCSGWGS